MRVASIEIAAKAVLFDMDGVVVDSRSVIEMAWREVVRKFDGRELTELEIRTVAHGRTPEQTIETLFPEYGDEQRQEIWSEAARIEMSAPYEAIPGVEDFIERLSSSGIAIGLVTSSWPEKIEYVLGLLNLREVFSTVVNRDDVTRGKPFPDPYLLDVKGWARLRRRL